MFKAAIMFALLLPGATALPAHAQGASPGLDAPAPVIEEVAFNNGDVTLRGSVMIPVKPFAGPHPAVIFLHGSGPMTRDGFRDYAEEYAQMGVASLYFDKRGAGVSDPGEESLDGLAGDALAAVAYMESRGDIDADRVGFWGISQAGWVASRAMALSPGVDFLIMVSGGGASPLESELASWEHEFDKAELAGGPREQARTLVNSYYAYLGRVASRQELLDQMAQAKASGGALAELADYLEGKLPPHDQIGGWEWVYAYQPRPDIAKINAPVLLLFGDRDRDHPSDVAIESWRSSLEQAGNADVTIVVFPGAGHGIRMREGYEGPGKAPFADGYRDLMAGWLWRHVVTGVGNPSG